MGWSQISPKVRPDRQVRGSLTAVGGYDLLVEQMKGGVRECADVALSAFVALEKARYGAFGAACGYPDRAFGVAAVGAFREACGGHGEGAACDFPDTFRHGGGDFGADYVVFVYGRGRNAENLFLDGNGVGGDGAEVVFG